METTNDIFNYYTLRGHEYNDGNTILETSLGELIRNCLKISRMRH